MTTTLTPTVVTVALVFSGIIVNWVINKGTEPEPENVHKISSATSGNGDFGFQLLSVIKEPSKSDNLVMSPLSLSIAMAMLEVGAKGRTSDDIRRALSFPFGDNLHQYYQDLLKEVAALPSTLEKDAKIKASLVIPNRIFVAKTFSVSSDFNETLTSSYGAGAEIVDYTKRKEAAGIINNFVSTSTQDKIKDLVSENDFVEDTKLVLVNAIHFKAQWEHTFEHTFTSKKLFFAFGTDSKDVDMMFQTMSFPHGEHPDLDAKSISLEYRGISDYRRMFMLVILPNKKDGLAKLEETLKTVPLTHIVEAQQYKRVSVELPKFKVESTVELNDPLCNLGCGSIFTDNADFSGITENNSTRLKVSKVIQKAFVEVHEKGTEAAAATAITNIIVTSTQTYTTPVPFFVDRPFLAVIVLKVEEDNGSDKTPVFIARVQNPQIT